MGNHDNHILIMAGGEGTRFAPLSTPNKPKQFLNLLHPSRSLLQQTFDRIKTLVPAGHIHVATNRRYLGIVREQLPEIPVQNITGETQKKNTGPSLAWVGWRLFGHCPQAVVAAIPADHFITPAPVFGRSLEQAFALAKEQNAIVTFGIRPAFPSAQFGYIHAGPAMTVKRFVEKPDAKTAQGYLTSGDYFWNSGIFVFPVRKMIACIEQHLPEIHALLQKGKSLEAFFTQAPSVSIDYGVMEKTRDLLMLEAPFEWSDVGTWENLSKLAERFSLKLTAEVAGSLRLLAMTAIPPPRT